MKSCASVLLALLACSVLAVAQPAEEEEGKQAQNAEKAEPKADDKAAAEDDKPIDIPLPVGPPVKGLKVPQYDEFGNLQFLFDAEVARRIDETHIEMENLKIDAYGEDGKKFYIELPKSVFNLETRILDGTEHVLIRREDFEITGDGGQFHVKTRYAKILGNVKMIIFNTDSFEE